MTEVVIVALLSLVGTLIGSLGGIMAANKLTNYRIQQLEEKVEKHNKVIERKMKQLLKKRLNILVIDRSDIYET